MYLIPPLVSSGRIRIARWWESTRKGCSLSWHRLPSPFSLPLSTLRSKSIKGRVDDPNLILMLWSLMMMTLIFLSRLMMMLYDCHHPSPHVFPVRHHQIKSGVIMKNRKNHRTCLHIPSTQSLPKSPFHVSLRFLSLSGRKILKNEWNSDSLFSLAEYNKRLN